MTHTRSPFVVHKNSPCTCNNGLFSEMMTDLKLSSACFSICTTSGEIRRESIKHPGNRPAGICVSKQLSGMMNCLRRSQDAKHPTSRVVTLNGSVKLVSDVRSKACRQIV